MALGRRLLIGTGVLALGTVGGWAVFWQQGDYRLGQARLVPPLLRARYGDGERLYGLVRRREREELPAYSLRTADSGERIEIFALNAATLEPIFLTPLLSVMTDEYQDAGILGEQNATIWIHVGGLGAASAVDGRMLADGEGIVSRNPRLTAGMPQSRIAYSFRNGLEFNDRNLVAWRLDPRTFLATPARQAPEAGLATPYAPAPWVAGGIRGQALASLGGAWLGLLAEGVTAPDPRQARIAVGPSRLWRGTAAQPAPQPVPGKPGVTAPPPVAEGAPVAVEDGPLFDAMLMVEGVPPLDPAGALLLYKTAPNAPWRLARIGTDGAVAWRTPLPLATVNTLLPGTPNIILAGRKEGTDSAGPEVIVSVDLGTGARRAREVATGEALSA